MVLVTRSPSRTKRTLHSVHRYPARDAALEQNRAVKARVSVRRHPSKSQSSSSSSSFKGQGVGLDAWSCGVAMINEQFREMVSLIARGRQQWCDCLRRYSLPAERERACPFPPFFSLTLCAVSLLPRRDVSPRAFSSREKSAGRGRCASPCVRV